MADKLQKIIDKIAKEQQYKDYSSQIKTVSCDGANYSSELFSVKISAPNKPDLNLFAKVSIFGQHVREQTAPFPEYEILFYDKLIKVFEDIQDNNDVLAEDRLRIPKCYGIDATYLGEVLVLENMIDAGFKLFDRFQVVDWKFASAAVKELAKLHALSIAYYEEESDHFNKLLAPLKTGLSYIKGFMPMIEKSISETIKVVKEENKAKFEKFFENKDYKKKFEKCFLPLKRPALVHVDYRPSNLMYAIRDDGSYEIAILDFQTFQVGSPVLDLLYFIMMSTDEEFRNKYFDTLVKYYYKELGFALKRLHIDIDVAYPKEDFEYELKEMMPFGLFMTMFILPIVTVDPEDAPVVEDVNSLSFKINSVYVERVNGIINDYVKWGVL